MIIGKTWKQLTPIHSAEGEYWMISYFTAGEVFKFAPQAGWSGGDFGGEATLNDEAGSDIHADGTNLMIDTPAGICCMLLTVWIV